MRIPVRLTMTAIVAVLSVVAVSLSASGADKAARAAKRVELFEAIKAGDIAVKLIPKDAKEANVLIENKAKQPLEIKLPEAFAGVPVLAQVGGFGGGGFGGGNVGGGLGGGGGGGQNQAMGGGMGGMGGGGGMGGMGGMFNVAPDKVGKFKVATVCLEHGKADPNPRVAYEIRPIESFTQDHRVAEVCRMLGRGEVPQNAAQAAAWHFTDGLSWEQLAAKDRVKLSNGYTEKYFSPQELAAAMRVTLEAARRAEGKKLETPRKHQSLSQN